MLFKYFVMANGGEHSLPHGNATAFKDKIFVRNLLVCTADLQR